jgi:hypothetical protein
MELPLTLNAPDGLHDLYVVFRGPDGDVAKFDWVEFQGRPASGSGAR